MMEIAEEETTTIGVARRSFGFAFGCILFAFAFGSAEAMALIAVVTLLAVGLVVGLKLANWRVAGLAVAAIVSLHLVIAITLTQWVVSIDPHRDAGRVPLPAPWSTLLPWLALTLLLGFPMVVGGFSAFSIGDFILRDRARWLRLFGYVVVLGLLVAFVPWIIGVPFD